MANDHSVTPPRRKKGGWLKKLGFACGMLIALLVVTYFVATSSGFLTNMILPRVSKALGAEVTVSDASISPFSEVVLHNLKVRTTGSEPLVAAAEVRARYNLRQILGGNIVIDEVTLASPVVVIVENPDGGSNLDPITKAQKAGEGKSTAAAQPSKPSKPLRLDLRKLSLNDATIRQLTVGRDGEKEMVEISHLNVALANVKNGQTGKLTVSAGIKEEKSSPKADVSGVLEAKASGEFTFGLSPELAPAGVKGTTQLQISRADGSYSELVGGALALDCEVTPVEIKKLSLHLERGTNRLGELRVSGPFSADKKEGKLTVSILSVDRKLLNLFGAKMGVKFGTTTINSTNQIEIAKAGSLITAVGQMDVSKFQIKRASNSTPTLDLRADYNVAVDLAHSNSVLQSLNLSAVQAGNPLLTGDLSSPMRLAWGGGAGEVGDSTFTLTLSGLNLPDWKPFLGDAVSAGKISAQTRVVSQKGGDIVMFDISSQTEGLDVRFGSNRISHTGLALKLSGQATEMKQFKLAGYSLEVSHQKNNVLSVSGSGSYAKGEKPGDNNADMEVAVEVFAARMLELIPQTDASFSSGTVKLKGRLVEKGGAQSIIGNFALSDLTGKSGQIEVRSLGVTADLDVAKTPSQFQIRKLAGKLTESGQAGGSFDVSGNYDLQKGVAQFNARLADFNQYGLRPVLQPMLADKKLVSVALGANAAIRIATNGPSALKGDLHISKLVVSDPKNELPATPLEAKMQFDVAMDKNVADIHQFQITLTSTSKAKNELQLSGQVDASQTNAIRGSLKLVADSLDLTTYYDIFGGKKEAATQTASAAPTPSTAPAPANGNEEPKPEQLPFQNFSADATINKFYLREVEVADAHTTVKLDGGHVVVSPFKLTLNGAPVIAAADVDMGIPGYKYDVSLDAGKVPLTPLVNSFQPEHKGEIGGTLTANAQFKGQGMTGASLQKNLSGKFDVQATNLNYSVKYVENPMLKSLVNVVGAIPDLLQNPADGALSFLQGAAGKGNGGLTGTREKAPIDAVTMTGQAAAGQITLSQAQVRSSAFLAEASGTVTLAPVLSNSVIQIPVSVSLSRAISDQLGLTPANTPTNAPYVKLPDFVTMKGTVGAPKTDIDKLKLASLALQRNGSGASGGIIQGLTGLLNKGNNAGTNTGTNQPASPVNNALDSLFGPKKK